MTTEKAPGPAEQPKALGPAKQTGLDVIRHDLEARSADLLAVLPKGMDPARFIRVSLMALTKNPTLAACTPASVIRSIFEAAVLGLEPTGAAGGAHLVPFRKKGSDTPQAQLILDYRGILHLIAEGGGGVIVHQVVYEGDEFVPEYGTSPRIVHRPHFATIDPTKITHVYAYPLSHPEQAEVMTKEQIDLVRARSRAANDGPWVTDFAEMARKTVIKRLSKSLDLIPKFREAIEADTEREFAAEQSATAKATTLALRDQLRERASSLAPTEAPSGPETAEVPTGMSDVSADQQTAETAAAEDAGAGPAEEKPPLGICGVLDQQLDCGPCVLPLGHKGKPHQDAKQSRWPYRT